MMGKSHLVISTGLTLSVLGLTGQSITLPLIAVTAISALLPDIDEPNSLLVSSALPKSFLQYLQGLLVLLSLAVFFFGQAFTPWNMVIAALTGLLAFLPFRSMRKVVMIVIGVSLIAFAPLFVPWCYIIGSLLIVCALLPHRGLTHTVYGLLVWSGILYFTLKSYDQNIWLAGGLSYLLHLLADSLTNHGIRPIPPFKWRLRIDLMSTGTWKGSVVEGIFIALTIVAVWSVFIQHLEL
ncbi:metal-dependent hydrolase [Paenibacillus sp. MMO-177]|uniref:metal-dependent hydrolase n=1 Tax=Paenibacillus sp. MMO-177 TaxID=3081289 RepID=UPI00301903FF